ncbi:MAG: prepilin-type N-terminal cleavage/methylation domain-containing protein [Candidatus Wallbacteria bacterium]|nr:prepilin-type N-terminal cleavage/methylation domain-containing protein [Candidatus Wallbacteria bacterium]
MRRLSRLLSTLPNNRRAFTFAEVLIGMGIAGIIMATVYGIYHFGIKVAYRGFDETALQMDSRQVLLKICEDLNFAESIEEISNSHIKIKKFFTKGDVDLKLYGDRNTQDITYRVLRENGRGVIRRYIDIDGAVIMTADEIDENLFTAYVEKDILEQDKEGNRTVRKVFRFFNTFLNESKDRKNIVLVRLDLKAAQGNEKIEVITKAALPFVHNLIKEPNWNGGNN